jgi:uncharacterized protein
MTTATDWIERLHLTPHPEGGYFIETYRSPHTLPTAHLPRSYDAPRAMATAIYFLLEGEDFSAFHRLKGDEIWHHYAGCALTLHLIDADGSMRTIHLGTELGAGQHPQVIIPADTWFAAAVDDPTSYVLVGCTMAPGFTYADLELGDRETLSKTYPEHAVTIVRLTRPSR